MNDKKPVSVIILNWNGEKLLDRFLPSVLKYTPDSITDIIVADNGSTDGSLRILADKFPSVKVISFTENYGFAEGYNKALKESDYQYTVLLNSDVEVKDDWLTPLYRFMENTPDAGACQPKIHSVDFPDKFEYAGAAGGFLDRYGYPYCRGRILTTVESDSGQYDDTVPVFWASGAALMVRTDAYFKAGGLDPAFFAHMEEIDLCWRMWLKGYKVYCVGDSTVYHLGGGSLPASNPKKTYLNFRNNLLMLHKNLPPGVRSRRLFIRRIIDILAWTKFVLTLDFPNASALLKAHSDFSHLKDKFPTNEDSDTPDLLKRVPNTAKSIFSIYFNRKRN